MCRFFLVVCAIAGLTATQAGMALARSGEIWIGPRAGGYFFLYAVQGKQMISSGNSYRVRGDQSSAAAIQVLFVKRHAPERICASPIAKLQLHQPYDPITKKTIRDSRKWLIALIGRSNLKRLGPLPEFEMGFKTVRATDYLGRCKTKAIACNVMWCGW